MIIDSRCLHHFLVTTFELVDYLSTLNDFAIPQLQIINSLNSKVFDGITAKIVKCGSIAGSIIFNALCHVRKGKSVRHFKCYLDLVSQRDQPITKKIYIQQFNFFSFFKCL